MWVRIINKIRYGYITYKNACNDKNRIQIKFDGLYYVVA